MQNYTIPIAELHSKCVSHVICCSAFGDVCTLHGKIQHLSVCMVVKLYVEFEAAN
jgi:hypothetical protein